MIEGLDAHSSILALFAAKAFPLLRMKKSSTEVSALLVPLSSPFNLEELQLGEGPPEDASVETLALGFGRGRGFVDMVGALRSRRVQYSREQFSSSIHKGVDGGEHSPRV